MSCCCCRDLLWYYRNAVNVPYSAPSTLLLCRCYCILRWYYLYTSARHVQWLLQAAVCDSQATDNCQVPVRIRVVWFEYRALIFNLATINTHDDLMFACMYCCCTKTPRRRKTPTTHEWCMLPPSTRAIPGSTAVGDRRSSWARQGRLCWAYSSRFSAGSGQSIGQNRGLLVCSPATGWWYKT